MPLFINTDYGRQPVPWKHFPGGEILLNLNEVEGVRDAVWSVEAVIKSSDDLVALILLTDALKRQYRRPADQLSLVIPYIPYARQDRVCNEGEPFSLKAIAAVINSLGYGTVECWDQHSYVTEAVVENCTSFPSHEIITPIRGPSGLEAYFQKWRSNIVVVAPDAGGEKRAREFAKHFQFEKVIACSKDRDPRTGEVKGVSIGRGGPLFIGGARYLIVDDICDGGRTFIEVAKVLKGTFPGVQGVDLFVTHGIFSKGVNALAPWIDTVFTTNSLLLEPDQPLDTLIERKPVCA